MRNQGKVGRRSPRGNRGDESSVCAGSSMASGNDV